MADRSNGKVSAAFHEVYSSEPTIVGRTRRKFGAARAGRQKVAIALSKARRAGADIPQRTRKRDRRRR